MDGTRLDELHCGRGEASLPAPAVSLPVVCRKLFTSWIA